MSKTIFDLYNEQNPQTSTEKYEPKVSYKDASTEAEKVVVKEKETSTQETETSTQAQDTSTQVQNASTQAQDTETTKTEKGESTNV